MTRIGVATGTALADASKASASQNFYPLFEPLTLRGRKPLAVQSAKKHIFEHPHDDRLLVKIVRLDATEESWGWRKFFKYRWRGGAYRDLLRHLNEYALVQARASEPIPSIARIFGLVDTDLGPGLVVEKIAAPDGSLAPTLQHILARGRLTPELRTALNAFMDDLSRHEVILNNIGLRNIVYVKDGAGSGRFVLVDGFGDRTLIPLCSMSKWVNRLNTRRRFRQLLRRCGKSGSAKPNRTAPVTPTSRPDPA